MQQDPGKRIETIFHAARERQPGPEREAYLDGACGEDTQLRSRLETLLQADQQATSFLEEPAVTGTLEGPGSSIGPYKLLQEIGEGGMGVVYMAEQVEPVRRKVALKVIKLGMDTVQVIARFEAERQALALMDHACIARVLDAGATETGRPYFVMELVRGVPINEYCDTHKLSTDQRLGLFVDVCRAVQHAHQKGVIHRDLKPTNVLVTSNDGTPMPKIIDFGVAKATNQRLTERTLFTEFHQFIGTPEYMSPEQAEMSALDVDTRSDIYSLGVLLYELLTGSTPTDPSDLRTAGFEEMTRLIREEEPPAPSTRISKLDAEGQKIANHDSRNAGALSRHFRGDLDWIVMKALEKDRTRRYETASAFAQDVLRHLGDQPVEAGPPGAVYRLRKFAHRNRRAVAAALVIVALIGLGLAGTTAGLLRASAEAARSRKISDSLQDVLAMTDPARAASKSELEGALATVKEVFGEDHATVAVVLNALAMQLYDGGEFVTAEELCRESLGISQRVYGERSPSVAITQARLGSILRARGDAEEAETALRAALEIFAGVSDTPGLAGYDVRVSLADLLRNRGELEEADELLGEALAILRASPTPAHYRILETLEMRALVRINQAGGDLRETVREVYDETHAFYPDDSPMLAIAALGYGRTLLQAGEFDVAEPYLREAVQRFRAAGSGGFYLVIAIDNLFQIVRGRGDEASVLETDELLAELIEAARKIWGPELLAKTMEYYAERMIERGRAAEAIATILDAYRVLVDAGRPAEERDSLRGEVIEAGFHVAVKGYEDPEIYALAAAALELGLADEPDNPFLRASQAAVQCRQGDYARAAETLDALPDPISSSRDGRKVTPMVQAFRALAHAHLGNEERAREGLEAARAVLEDGEMGREIEALLEPTPSSGNG